MRTAPFTIFGETKEVPVKVYRNNKLEEDVDFWDDEMWVERGEDWYGLMSYPKSYYVRVVERDVWLKCK